MASVARKYNNTNQLGILPTGLGILAHIYSHLESNNNINNNIVLKSGLRSLTKTPITSKSSIILTSSSNSSSLISNSIITNDDDYYYNCQLKSCHLCTKPLRPDQDIYMYRGDQGFCSEECRNRQIMLDERREKEALLARQKIASNSLSSIDCRGCVTCRLLEDLRQQRRRRKNSNNPKNQPLFSLS